MQRVALYIVAICVCGCGDKPVQKSDFKRTEFDITTSELADAIAIANSKDPAVRLLAWQREWIKEGDYARPTAGIYETERNEFRYRWTFDEQDAMLTVSEQPQIDDEDKDLLCLFINALTTEWRIGPRFIYAEDTKAGNEACETLKHAVIDEAIKTEENTPAAIHRDPYAKSKAERIRMMKGPNRALAMALAYGSLHKSGKTISGQETSGDVFSFRAIAEFSADGRVSATLFINGN